MPTKLNHAGNQQNYVPAGHGDASGEYGDNDTGSNIHIQFKKFEKPKEKHVYIKKGGKWYLTPNTDENIERLKNQNIKYYTKQEMEDEKNKKTNKTLETSQTQEDKKIEKVFGNDCTVCFGKGYDQATLSQIENDAKTLVNEWEDLKTHVKMMGDKNSLEKLVKAKLQSKPITEEEIEKEINRIKGFFFMSSRTNLRDVAINNINSQRNFKLANVRNAYAYWQYGTRAMVYLPIMKKTTQEQKEKEYVENFKSSNKSNGTFFHEMGHAIHDMVTSMNKDLTKKVSEATDNYENFSNITAPLKRASMEFESKIIELAKKNYNKDEKRYNISSYGATNTKEFIAECFSAHYTGMNNQLADETVEEVRKYYDKLKEIRKYAMERKIQ